MAERLRNLFHVSCFPMHRKRNARGRMPEMLEDRRVLAVDPLISEFQAINDSTLTDKDGDFSDWIEIRNPGAETIDLEGWYLTDDLADLRKWQFPTTTLSAGREIIVFASSKNERAADAELHTNFRLAGGGESLALVRPDGVTIAQEFNPYPAQREDQSYGVAFEQSVSELVTAETAVKAFVPSDDALRLDWAQLGFDDTDWQAADAQAIGYEQLEPGSMVRDDFVPNLSEDWTISIPDGGTSTVTVDNGVVSFDTPLQQTMGDTRGLAPIVYRAIPNESLDWDFAAHVSRHDGRGNTGIAVFDPTTGQSPIRLEYALASRFQTVANSDSTENVRAIGEESFFLRMTRDSQANTYSTFFKIAEDDEWTLVDVVEDDSEDAVAFIQNPHFALYTRTTSRRVEADFGSIEINVPEESAVYGPSIELDVVDSMFGVNSSMYARLPFTVDGDPSRFDDLNLFAQFDDGFKAYLNGHEIASQNVPIETGWNSTASSEHGAFRGTIGTTRIPLAEHIDKLQIGENILAVHAMNVAADDDDFFVSVELDAAEILAANESFFLTPSPGLPNVLPAAPSPIIVGDDGVFFGQTTIEIDTSGLGPDFEIHYTLDGTEPTLRTPAYSEPIELVGSAMFQARAFDISERPQFSPSLLTSASYIAVNEELRDRTSNLPLVILDTLDQGLPASNSTTLRPINSVFFDVDPVSGRSRIDDGLIDYLGRAGIRDRGSSTASQPKPNLTFETWGPSGTTADDDFRVSLAGLPADSDWVLHAPYSWDRTAIRNPLAFALGNETGEWSPRTRFLEVYLNRRDEIVGEEDYVGLYILMEKIKSGSERLDIAQIDTDDNAEPEISGGYIFKFDREDPDAPKVTFGGQAVNWVEPKSPVSRTARDDQKATDEQQQWLTDYFREMQRALRRPDINDPDGYSKYINVDSWVDHHLLNVFLDNVDAFALSAYFHKDRGQKVGMGPNWDFDRSSESLDDRDDDPEKWGGSGNSNFFDRGWFTSIFRDPGFWQKYVDRWQELRRTTYSLDHIYATIDGFVHEIREVQERNNIRWRSIRPRFGSWDGELDNLREWLRKRVAFIDSQFATPPVIRIGDRDINPDDKGEIVTVGQAIEISRAPVTVATDTKLISGEPGEAMGSFFVPVNDDLGNTWTEIDFDDSQWQRGPMGVGVGSSSFQEILRTEIQPNLVDENATNLFTRIAFTVDDLDAIDRLVLRVKYDDGVQFSLNGHVLGMRNLRDNEPLWDSRAMTHANNLAVVFEEVDLTSAKPLLRQGENILAIRTVNSSRTSSDLLLAAELVSRKITLEPGVTGDVYYTTDGTDPRGPDGSPSPSATLLDAPILTIDQTTTVIARTFDETDRGSEARIVRTDWSGPTSYHFATEETPLVISEIHYNPSPPTDAELAINADWSSRDFEFLEIYNPTDASLSLTGVHLTDGVEASLASGNKLSIDSHEHLVIASNVEAFAIRYGADVAVHGTFEGNLNDRGEDVDLRDASGDVIFSVSYSDNDPWPIRADGFGASLELNIHTVTRESQNKFYQWRGSTEWNGSPGRAGAEPTGVVINEVISNPPAGEGDRIELFNNSDRMVDIGGWHLSDSVSNPTKFTIPSGTMLDSRAFIQFDESQFDGGPNGFGLNGLFGDSVWLVSTDEQENVLTFVDDVHFDGIDEGVSLGRAPDGTGRIVPQAVLTMGAPNSEPFVGAIVITEVHYDPSVIPPSTLEIYAPMSRNDLEFVEIFNSLETDVDLEGWRIRGGIDHDFEAVTLAAQDTLLVVPFNPENPRNSARLAAFRSHYGLDEQTQLVGGFAGQLNNSDDRIEIQRPGTPPSDEPNRIPYFQEDEVLYDDLSPWPVIDAGVDFSLQRNGSGRYGNAPSSWRAEIPSPGVVLFRQTENGDFNQDGTVDATDIDLLSAAIRSGVFDPKFDLNSDQQVDQLDRIELVHHVIGTNFGDTNLDGLFNSQDLVAIFTVNKYEDDIPLNSTWADGDWNGDGETTSADLVLAFSDGGYTEANAASAFGSLDYNQISADLVDSFFEEERNSASNNALFRSR